MKQMGQMKPMKQVFKKKNTSTQPIPRMGSLSAAGATKIRTKAGKIMGMPKGAAGAAY